MKLYVTSSDKYFIVEGLFVNCDKQERNKLFKWKTLIIGWDMMGFKTLSGWTLMTI